jgi:rod shape-determining protein MreC
LKLLGNKKLLMLMLGLICFIVLMGVTYGKNEYATWPGRFLKDTVSFAQGLVYKPTGAIVQYFQEIGQLRTVYEENRVLRETLSKYARDTSRLNDLELQNKRLQDALGFTEQQKQMNKYKFRIAEVVQFIQQGKTITINLGEKDNIHTNMAVISVEGLIGRVTEVTPFYSNVQLLTGIDDKASIESKATTLDSKAIAVTSKGSVNESFGLIERFDPDTQMLVMTKIDRNDPLKVGDTIITSGKGLVFPRGIEIGTVVERKEGDLGITHVAMIKPFASFNHLREVFVVEVPELK